MPPAVHAAAEHHHATRSTVVGLVACAIAAALFGPAVAAHAESPPSAPTAQAADAGSIGLRLLDVPVQAREDPRAQLYIVDHLAPGAVIERRIEVSNTTSAPMHVVLYPGAAAIVDGVFLGADGHTANDVSTWTTISPETVDVPSGGAEVATVTIAVPSDAAPGEQYAAVWAETRSAPTTGAGISQVSRVGVRLYLSIGPGGAPAPGFDIVSLIANRSAEGMPTLTATVHNTGGRALDLSGELELRDGPGGLHAGPFPAALGTTLAIGASGSVTIVLDDQLPAGPWTAQITLRSGLLEHRREEAITFPGAAAPNTARPQPAAPFRPAWYIVVAGLGALTILAAAAILVRRRRRLASLSDPEEQIRLA